MMKTHLLEILNKKVEFIHNNCSNNYTRRYCNQDCFNILLCGGYYRGFGNVVNTVNQISGKNFEYQNDFPPMIEERYESKAVCLKAEIYVFGGFDKNHTLIKSVQKYSPSTNTWNKVGDMFDDRKDFCVCAFMDKIVVIGGCYGEEEDDDDIWSSSHSCLLLDTKVNKWKEVARMNQARYYAACAVFEERVVVSGGCDNNHTESNKVESYDVVSDKWSLMSNMTSSKYCHSLTVAKNKLFVIGYGEHTCEVFDYYCKKFVEIRSPQTIYLFLNRAISIGSKIIVFQNIKSSIFIYDVDKDEWSEESCEVTKILDNSSCVKLPWF